MPAETLSDGAAQAVSAGFFDSDNAPAWDTWVGYIAGTLEAWIPAHLVPLVEETIDINPEQCLRWADRPH